MNVAGGWIAPWQLAHWIERYDNADIVRGVVPPRVKLKALSAARIVTSTRVRTLQSAQLLASREKVLSDPIFGEAGLPYALWRGPRLPATLWTAVFRVAWFCGFSAHAESHAEAKLRARIAAQSLISLAQESGPVFLVGHGIMNGLIAAQLKSLGLRGPARQPSKYWEFSTFTG